MVAAYDKHCGLWAGESTWIIYQNAKDKINSDPMVECHAKVFALVIFADAGGFSRQPMIGLLSRT